MIRRRFLAMALAGPAGMGPSIAAAPPRSLPLARSLPAELAAAQQLAMPLVVMVSLHGCAFCRIVREQYLLPLSAETGQPVVQLDMRGSASVRDFRGRELSHGELVRDWGIQVAPTLLFFGAGGREAAPRLPGVATLDFYGGILESRLLQARKGGATARS